MGHITVDKALKEYYLIYNVVIATASFAFIAALILFFRYNYFSGANAVIISMLAVIIYIVLFSVFNLLLSNIWMFWAFSRVRNVHELKKRFISLGEISEESTLFKRIENSAENDRKYWKLRLKFAQEDIFVDDVSISEETIIYYSKTMCIMSIVLSIFIFAFGTLLLAFAVDKEIFMAALLGVFLIILAVFFGYRYGYKKLKNREPQLILNSKGISTNKAGFYRWEEIEKYMIITGRNAYLKYTHSRGEECINISYLDIKSDGIKLSKLLMVYRERNKLQNNIRQ